MKPEFEKVKSVKIPEEKWAHHCAMAVDDQRKADYKKNLKAAGIKVDGFTLPKNKKLHNWFANYLLKDQKLKMGDTLNHAKAMATCKKLGFKKDLIKKFKKMGTKKDEELIFICAKTI